MKYIVIFILAFVLSNAANANPFINPIYKNLTKIDESKGFNGVINELKKPQYKKMDNDDNQSLLVWLRDMSLKKGKDLRYGFVYAENLKKAVQGTSAYTGDAEGTVAVAYFISALRLENSISRCDDRSAGNSARLNWLTKHKEYKKIFWKHGGSKKAQDFNSMLKIAEGNKDVNASWVCEDGISAFNKALESGEKPNEIKSKESLGKNYVIDTSKHIKFINDEEWATKRKENSEKLKKYLLSGE